jgi:hypothetical protein|tara:strand:+ start:22438 stop:22857 length:420 start_codon:yes stop_codon:yes gene_type:complete
MADYYLSDANLTDRLSADLTSSELDTSTKRQDLIRGPATARVDALTPALGPFGDSADTGFSSIINLAAICYACAMAWRILTNDPNNGQAVTWEQMGDKIMMVDAKGQSHLTLSATVQVGTPDIKRDRDDESDDDVDVVE